MLEGVLGRLVIEFLHVGGDDHGGRRPFGQGRAHGSVQHVGQLLRHVDRLQERRRDVLEETVQVDLLLVGAADGAPGGLADDRHHRHVVELGVVEAVEQMDRARTSGGHAHPGPVAEHGPADRFEGGHLLVPALDEPRPVLDLGQLSDQPVDAVPGVAEDLGDAPLGQSAQQMVGDVPRHVPFLPSRLLPPGRSGPEEHLEGPVPLLLEVPVGLRGLLQGQVVGGEVLHPQHVLFVQ